MAFNPSPKVAAARDAAQKFNYPIAILVFINETSRKIEYASYGKTKSLCDRAKTFGDMILDEIEDFVADEYNGMAADYQEGL